MLYFILGFVFCWTLFAVTLTIFDGHGGIELFDGFIIYIILIPVYVLGSPVILFNTIKRAIKKRKGKKKGTENEN